MPEYGYGQHDFWEEVAKKAPNNVGVRDLDNPDNWNEDGAWSGNGIPRLRNMDSVYVDGVLYQVCALSDKSVSLIKRG